MVAVQYADGVLFASENPSQALHKVCEIYDRIAFAAVGRYNEFENLRIAGVRLADMRGYAYDRRDVTGRGLANAYAQTLGTIFSSGGEKPYEVELFVAEVGDAAGDDQIYRLTYDGQVADEHGYAVMGGAADVVAGYLSERYTEGASLARGRRAGGRGARPHDRRARRAPGPGDPGQGPRGRRSSTAPGPSRASSARIGPYRLEALLGDRGAEQSNPAAEAHAPGTASTDASPDDPTDPTDQVSGDVEPLEDPVAPNRPSRLRTSRQRRSL